MKIYRFIQGLLVGMTLLTTACTEQENASTPSGDPTTLRATIADDETATRSIVIDNPGIKLESFWKAGDRIGVFGSSAQNVSFSVADGTISADGKTADFKSTSDIPSGDLTAYYPYSTSATLTNEGLKLQFSTTQHYTEVGGVAQPDPEACVMVGSGSKGGGINFLNVMAVLKVGQVFDKKTAVSSVEFRDLNGAPVSGTYTITFRGGIPEANFIGNGQVLTLDLGTEGMTVEENSLVTVFLVVPARHYPKGFEVTFVAADGTKTSKTASSKEGKTLQRSVVYPVGDVTTYEDVPGMTYELKPTAQIMTQEKLDMVTVTSYENDVVRTDDGEKAVDNNGNTIRLPHLTMTVHKDMNPRVGGWLIFNQPSTDMPTGGIYRVQTCKLMADGEHYEVYAVPEPNFAAPFEELTIGEPLYDDDGNLNPGGGVDIDISSYVKEVRDGEGNVVNTRSLPNYEMNATERLNTRAVGHSSFTTPALTLSMDDGSHCSCDVSAKMSVGMRLAIGVIHGELQYIYQTVNPKLEMKTTFGLYGKYEVEKRKHLWTFYTAGIPIGPVVVLPEVAFNAFGGISGEVKFSASTTFNYNLGTYGIIYNKGQGVSFKRDYTEPQPQELNPQFEAGGSLSLTAYGGIGMQAGISIYAMCSLGAATDAKLNFGIAADKGVDDYSSGVKLHLTPEIDIKPYIAVVGGRFAKMLDGIGTKVEFDPIWERLIIPNVKGWAGAGLTYSEPNIWGFRDEDDKHILQFQEPQSYPIGPGPITYHMDLKGKPLVDCQVVVEVLESSNYNIVWHTVFDEEEFDTWFPIYKNAGYPLLWPHHVNVSMDDWQVVERRVVGTYAANSLEESSVIEGSFSHNFPPNVACSARIGLEVGNYKKFIGLGDWTVYY